MITGEQTAALRLLDESVSEHKPSSVWALFSGGHDSLCSTHLAACHPAFTGVVHVNTGIGIEETRVFVRETCREQGWPLLEYHPERYSYEDLVRKRGMPSGPKSHSLMYFYLKQQQLDRHVREHKQDRHDRVVLVSGIRRGESTRRKRSAISVPMHRKGAKVWVSPILDWTARDCNAYIERYGLRRNEVSDVLHRSGECLCGALARHDEIEMIDRFYPVAGAEIHRLERIAEERGLPCKWAYSPPVVHPDQESFDLELCSSCIAGAGS